MSRLSRRQALIFFGASAATTALGPTLTGKVVGGQRTSLAEAAVNGSLNYTPIRLPHPLPIYQTADSFLPSGLEEGKLIPASANTQLSSYGGGGKFSVVKGDAKNRRIHLLSGLALNQNRAFPSSWGGLSYQ